MEQKNIELLFREEKYDIAISEIKKQLRLDSENGELFYYLFLAENGDYCNLNPDDIVNEVNFNRSLELAGRKSRTLFEAEYNFFKECDPEFRRLYCYAMRSNNDKVMELLKSLNKCTLTEKIHSFLDDLGYIIAFLDTKEKKIFILLTNYMYILTGNKHIYDSLNSYLEDEEELGLYIVTTKSDLEKMIVDVYNGTDHKVVNSVQNSENTQKTEDVQKSEDVQKGEQAQKVENTSKAETVKKVVVNKKAETVQVTNNTQSNNSNQTNNVVNQTNNVSRVTMLRNEVNQLYNFGTINYCTDQIFNWAYNYTKQVLANQGNPNAEPSRAYMITLIIDKFQYDIGTFLEQHRYEYHSCIRNLELSNHQKQRLHEAANKANGVSSTVGGGAAGAGLGLLFGGLLGAAVGGLFGAIAGKQQNDQNREKFYEVLRECLGIYTESLFQNNR